MNPRAANFGAEEVDLRSVVFTPALLACVPAEFARRYRVLPVFSSDRLVRIALADPSDLEALEALSHFFGRPVEICVAEVGQLHEFIERLFGLEGRG